MTQGEALAVIVWITVIIAVVWSGWKQWGKRRSEPRYRIKEEAPHPDTGVIGARLGRLHLADGRYLPIDEPHDWGEAVVDE